MLSHAQMREIIPLKRKKSACHVEHLTERNRPPSSSQLINIDFRGNVFSPVVPSKLYTAHVYISDLECPKSISRY